MAVSAAVPANFFVDDAGCLRFFGPADTGVAAGAAGTDPPPPSGDDGFCRDDDDGCCCSAPVNDDGRI